MNYMRKYRILILSFTTIAFAVIIHYGILYSNRFQFTKDYYKQQSDIGYSSCKLTTEDADGDCISNKNEIQIFDTDPNKPDTDGDGYTDFQEIIACFDPNSKNKMSFINADKWRVRSGIYNMEGKLLQYFNSNPLGSDNYCKEDTFIIKNQF
jgi:hypothetical protein